MSAAQLITPPEAMRQNGSDAPHGSRVQNGAAATIDPGTTDGAIAAPQANATGSDWRGWLRLLLEAVVTSIAIALCLAMTVLLGTSIAQAASVTAPENAPALLLDTGQGMVAAPLQHSDVQLRVTGPVVRARVVQTYSNPAKRWLHGSYRFPLPDDSAVDTLRIRVGERVIDGRIEPRALARRSFETARQEGKRASLLEQQRPNLFMAAVANIAPAGEVTIEIEYQQALKLADDAWTLSFPTVITPRYRPGSHGRGARGQEGSDADGMTAATRSLAWHPPGEIIHETDPRTADPSRNRLTMQVSIDAGLPVSRPVSSTHEITVAPAGRSPSAGGAAPDPGAAGSLESDANSSWKVQVAGDTLADRDFVLRWSPQPGESPITSLLLEAHEGHWYGLLSVAAPRLPPHARPPQARELIFVIDTSGSMHAALPRAREALLHALGRLGARDRFNLIEFNTFHRALFEVPVAANETNLDRARRFVRGLEATGGTEMAAAVRAALLSPVPAGLLSQVVFITDGAVENEDDLFDQIERSLGTRRLFTVGIGPAPNAWFMRRAAAAGRGTPITIAEGADVGSGMTRLFDRLSKPMLTGLGLRDGDGRTVADGQAIRDLYAADPIQRAFRFEQLPEQLFIEGHDGDQPWQDRIVLRPVTDRGIGRLWARERLDDLTQQIRRISHDGGDPRGLRDEATRLALSHHLVSDYTSLLAVEPTPVRPPAAATGNAQVPAQLPLGWPVTATSGAMTGQLLAQTDAALVWRLVSGTLLASLALLTAASLLHRGGRLADGR